LTFDRIYVKIKRRGVANLEKKDLNIRIDRELFDKFRYIAELDNHRASNLLRYLLLSRVREFEETHGEIVTE